MAESSPESTRAVLKSLDRMAHKVLESPKSDREAVYELMRARLGDAGRALNLSDKEVADFEVNYMTWLHALVDTIERGGGAPEAKLEEPFRARPAVKREAEEDWGKNKWR